MALTVETGQGLSDADSYVSISAADSYFLASYPTGQPLDWLKELNTANREVALRKATRYVDSEYGNRFAGLRMYGSQSLSWPRFNAVDRDGYAISTTIVPQAVKNAVCEAALAFVANTNAFNGSVAPESAGIVQESFSLGPISESITYSGSKEVATEYPTIQAALVMVLSGSGGVEIDRS